MATMRHCIALLVLGIALLLNGAPVAAQDLLPGIQKIVDSGKLKVAVVDIELPPMIRRNAKGELRGFDIALAKDIARKLGVKAEFVKAGNTQEDVIDVVAKGQADLGLSYLRLSVTSGMRVFFTRPYMIESDTFLINRVKGIDFNQDCPARSDFRRLLNSPGKVGLMAESIYDVGSQAFEPTAAPKKYRDLNQMMRAVTAGDLTVSIQGEVAAKYFLSRTQEAAIKVKLCLAPWQQKSKVAIAVRPDLEDLLRWLDLYIEARGIIVETDSLIYREDRTLN